MKTPKWMDWVVALICVAMAAQVVYAQKPTKHGHASVRERSYILAAKKVYGRSLSIAEARAIAQAEDRAAKSAKDGKRPYLLPDYLALRDAHYKKLAEQKRKKQRARNATRQEAEHDLAKKRHDESRRIADSYHATCPYCGFTASRFWRGSDPLHGRRYKCPGCDREFVVSD